MNGPPRYGETFLYRHFDVNGSLLYVGVSDDPSRRILNHLQKSPWAQDIVSMLVVRYGNRFDALEAEEKAIVTEKPRYNVKKAVGSHKYSVALAVDRETADEIGALAISRGLTVDGLLRDVLRRGERGVAA